MPIKKPLSLGGRFKNVWCVCLTGPSINDVCKVIDIVPPMLAFGSVSDQQYEIHATSHTTFFFRPNPLPLHCKRHLFMNPYASASAAVLWMGRKRLSGQVSLPPSPQTSDTSLDWTGLRWEWKSWEGLMCRVNPFKCCIFVFYPKSPVWADIWGNGWWKILVSKSLVKEHMTLAN